MRLRTSFSSRAISEHKSSTSAAVAAGGGGTRGGGTVGHTGAEVSVIPPTCAERSHPLCAFELTVLV